MRPDDFWDTTPAEFAAIRAAYRRRADAEMRSRYELTRWQASVMLSAWAKKAPKPHELMPLPWDKPTRSHDGRKMDSTWARQVIENYKAKALI